MTSSIRFPVLNRIIPTERPDLSEWIKEQHNRPCSQNSWNALLEKIRSYDYKLTKEEIDAVCFYALHIATHTPDSRKVALETLVKEVQKKTGSWDFLKDWSWEWVEKECGITLVSLGVAVVAMPESGPSQVPSQASAAPRNEFLDHAEILLCENAHTKNGYQILRGTNAAKAAEIKYLVARLIEIGVEKYLHPQVNLSNDLAETLREQLLQINQADADSFFKEITKFAEELGEIRKIRLITSFDNNFKPSSLDHDQLQAIYLIYQKKAAILKSVEDKFNSLLGYAGLPREIAKFYRIETSPLPNNKSISIGSCSDGGGLEHLIAYSVYTFLLINKLTKSERGWSGAITTFLDLSKVEELEKALNNQLECFHKYAKIFADLLQLKDNQIYAHVQLGQKPRSEVLESASSFITPPLFGEESTPMRSLRKGSPSDVCVLFNALSLNLNVDRKNFTSDQDFELALKKMLYLKSKIEEIYVLEKMNVRKINNGQVTEVAKTFMKDDPMRTNLVAGQLEQIYPRLDKLIQFQRHMIETTGKASLYDALGLDTCPQTVWNQKEREAYRNWAVKRVADFYRSMGSNPDIPKLESEFAPIDLTNADCVDRLEVKVQTLCNGIINK